jgi:hypothetical protein
MVRVSAVSHLGVRPSNEDRHLCYEEVCLFVVAGGIGRTGDVAHLNFASIDRFVRGPSRTSLPEQAHRNNVGRDSALNLLTRTRGVQEHADIHISERDRKPGRAKALAAEMRARGADDNVITPIVE